LAGKNDASFVMRKIGSKTGLTAAKARAAIVKPPEKKMTKIIERPGIFAKRQFFLRTVQSCSSKKQRGWS
jgi:hypothetical protein